MTLSSTESKTIYAGNGSTAAFAIPFMFLQDEDIEVVLSTAGGEFFQSLVTDYTLTGSGDHTGGVCSMTVPPQIGEILVVRRNPVMVQEVDYVENDAFPASSHEAALDKLTMICQSLAERLDRTITFKVSSAVSGVEMPEPSGGQVLAWSDEGDNLSNRDVSGLGSILLPVSVGEGGTGAVSPSEALTNLGFGDVGKGVSQSSTTIEALAAMDAEPADTAILKADLPDLLQAVYGDEAQTHVGSDLSALDVTRNHVQWTLAAPSQFSDVVLPYDGTYVFHVYPASNPLAIAVSYKTDGTLVLPDAAAGEIRIAVEQYNGRKSIVSLQNLEA